MKPRETSIIHQFYYVCIRTPYNYINYVTHAPLETNHLRSSHNPAQHSPIFADVRIEEDKYLTSKPFETFDPNHPAPNILRQIRIYVAVPGAEIFSAVLKPRPGSKMTNPFTSRLQNGTRTMRPRVVLN